MHDIELLKSKIEIDSTPIRNEAKKALGKQIIINIAKRNTLFEINNEVNIIIKQPLNQKLLKAIEILPLPAIQNIYNIEISDIVDIKSLIDMTLEMDNPYMTERLITAIKETFDKRNGTTWFWQYKSQYQSLQAYKDYVEATKPALVIKEVVEITPELIELSKIDLATNGIEIRMQARNTIARELLEKVFQWHYILKTDDPIKLERIVRYALTISPYKDFIELFNNIPLPPEMNNIKEISVIDLMDYHVLISEIKNKLMPKLTDQNQIRIFESLIHDINFLFTSISPSKELWYYQLKYRNLPSHKIVFEENKLEHAQSKIPTSLKRNIC